MHHRCLPHDAPTRTRPPDPNSKGEMLVPTAMNDLAARIDDPERGRVKREVHRLRIRQGTAYQNGSLQRYSSTLEVTVMPRSEVEVTNESGARFALR